MIATSVKASACAILRNSVREGKWLALCHEDLDKTVGGLIATWAQVETRRTENYEYVKSVLEEAIEMLGQVYDTTSRLEAVEPMDELRRVAQLLDARIETEDKDETGEQ